MLDDPFLRFDNVAYTYRKPSLRDWFGFGANESDQRSDLIHGIDFDLAKGEFCGLVGKNGAGKSTLLKLASGILHPDDGQITRPQSIANLIELGAAFNYKASGLDNLRLSCLLNQVPSQILDDVIQEMVAFADIGDAIHDPVFTYSSGMFARLAFSSQIFLEADLILVDEVLAVGDTAFVAKANRKMQQLRDDGVSFLFVTHDMTAVKTLCERALWIEQGRIKLAGSASEVVDEYLKDTFEGDKQHNYAKSTKPLSMTIGNQELNQQHTGSRRGTGQISIENLEILCGGVEHGLVVLEQGATLTLKLHLINKRLEKEEDLLVGVSLRNRRGVDYASVNSLNHAFRPKSPQLHGRKFIEIEITPPILCQGDYTVSVSVATVSENGEIANMDTIDDAISVRVYGDHQVHTLFLLEAIFKEGEVAPSPNN